MKPALLVIDLQKAYYKGTAKKSMDDACMIINRAIGLFRNKNRPVIWVQHEDEADGALPGLQGFDFIDSLEPRGADTRIVKTYNNSFNKTKLEESLKKSDVDTVIVSGYCAEYCIIATYWGAMNVDLRPVLLKDGIASDDGKARDYVEYISGTIGIGDLEKKMSDL